MTSETVFPSPDGAPTPDQRCTIASAGAPALLECLLLPLRGGLRASIPIYIHRRPAMKAIIAALCLVAFHSAAGAAPFRNGSFENSAQDPGYSTRYDEGDQRITGWTVLPNSIDYVGTENSASEGTRSIDLVGNDSRGGIMQSFDTLPGARYLVTFAVAGNPVGPPPIKMLEVTVGTETSRFLFDITGKSRQEMGWTDHQMTFVADESTTTIRFTADTTGQGCCFGPMLDNVRVVQIANPASPPFPWKYLFFVGLLLLAAVKVFSWSRSL
jgi:choice-of-anchor C domain-containing protein